MSRRRRARSFGESIAHNPAALRIYGSQVAELGALLDLSDNWSNRGIATALSLCWGESADREIAELSSRLRRFVPGRGSLAAHLDEQHGVEIRVEHIDRDMEAWARTAADRRLFALGLLVSSLDVDLPSLEAQYTSLTDAALQAVPVPLNWPEASAVAERASNDALKLSSIAFGADYRMSAWDVLGALAALARVNTDRGDIRLSAAASSLASGLRGSLADGAAAVFLLILSTGSPRFASLPFGRVRTEPDPIGALVGWIGDLFVWIRLARSGTPVQLPRLRELVDSWPYDEYEVLPLLVSACQTDGSPVGSGVVTAAEGLDRERLIEWASAAGFDAQNVAKLYTR